MPTNVQLDCCYVQVMIMLKFKNTVITVILVAVAVVHTAHGFPSYITKCKNDDKINECILNSAKEALPHIMKGDPALFIPDLNAYDPEDQVLNVNENFVYSLKNIKADSGVLSPISAKMDFDSSILEITMHLPHLIWQGKFSAKGNDFDEHGDATVTYENVRFTYKMSLNEADIDGKTYYQIKSVDTTGSAEHIKLKHEFDAESDVTGQAKVKKLKNKIKSALEGRLREICGNLVTYIANTIFKTASKDEVFV